MSRRNGRIPGYLLHKPSGQARVIIDDKHIYLGSYGSPESQEKYARLIAQLSLRPASRDTLAERVSSELSINELLVKYYDFAKSYYIKDGEPTQELASMAEALLPLRRLYGHTLAAEFGPKALQVVRQHLIDNDICRGVINNRFSRIKRVFKWAVAEELIPSSVYHGLQAVAGLRYGRTKARESEPVRPVADLYVAAVLPFVPPQVAGMIIIQRLTGMRPCEVVLMRPCDIDTSGEVWIFEPYDHKNRWRGHRKQIPLGPECQTIVRPFLARNSEAFIFSPKEAQEWRMERRVAHYRASRKTPVYPSELRARKKAKAARRKKTRKRPPRDRYDTDSYRKAIEYGFVKASKSGIVIPHWFPYQLRHTHATEIRKLYGIEAAQITLGHARADVTEVYAEKNMEAAIRIAKEMG